MIDGYSGPMFALYCADAEAAIMGRIPSEQSMVTLTCI